MSATSKPTADEHRSAVRPEKGSDAVQSRSPTIGVRTRQAPIPLSHVAILNRGDVGWIEGQRAEGWRWDEIIAETSAEKPGLVITWQWGCCIALGLCFSLIFLRAAWAMAVRALGWI